MSQIFSSSLSSLLLNRRITSSLVSSLRPYWWGHDTLEDKENRRRLKEESRIIKWTDPDSSMEAKHKYLYAPARIMDEASVLGAPGLLKFSTADYFAFVKQPILPYLTDYNYYVYKKQVSIYRDLIKSQMFLRERFIALGPDLAAAHFLCYRNCRVRFKGHDHWTDLDKYKVLNDVPQTYQPGWYIEAIDAAESALIYEGFQNLRNLVFLKYLDLSYCRFIDAWCLDRITGEYQDSLEYLDISGCPELNWNGIECLWRLRKLKTLVMYDLDHIKDLPLLCLMLLEIFPNLDIRGVDYIDPTLLEGTEHEHLLKDLDELRVLPLAEGDKEFGTDKVQDVESHDSGEKIRKESG